MGEIIGQGVAGMALVGGTSFYVLNSMEQGTDDPIENVTVASAETRIDYAALQAELLRVQGQFVAAGTKQGVLSKVKNVGFADRALAYPEDPACDLSVGAAKKDGLVLCDRFEASSNPFPLVDFARGKMFSVFPATKDRTVSAAFACAQDDAACNQAFADAIAEPLGAREIIGVTEDFACALFVQEGARSDYLAFQQGGDKVHAYVVGVACEPKQLSQNN